MRPMPHQKQGANDPKGLGLAWPAECEHAMTTTLPDRFSTRGFATLRDARRELHSRRIGEPDRLPTRLSSQSPPSARYACSFNIPSLRSRARVRTTRAMTSRRRLSLEDNAKIPADVEAQVRLESIAHYARRLERKEKSRANAAPEVLRARRRSSVCGTGVASRKDLGTSNPEWQPGLSTHDDGSLLRYEPEVKAPPLGGASARRPLFSAAENNMGPPDRRGRRVSVTELLLQQQEPYQTPALLGPDALARASADSGQGSPHHLAHRRGSVAASAVRNETMRRASIAASPSLDLTKANAAETGWSLNGIAPSFQRL